MFSNAGETALILLLALLLDAALGEPRWLWSRIPHPAVLLGRAIGWADTQFNSGNNRKLKGIGVMATYSLVMAVIGYLVSNLPDYGIIQILIVAILLAEKSLCQHVSAVADALRLSTGDGRLMVSRIVGRDTRNMDDSTVARTAIESGAENLSDGVVAPAFWFLLLGLPGLLVYKVVNTADSMIGYKTPKHMEFGWAAARFDDVLNWIPARITAFLIVITHNKLGAWRLIMRDAPQHRSPNAGWPEAAIAVSLNMALSGPRSYHGASCDYEFVFDEGRHQLTANDIDTSVKSLWRVWGAMVLITAFIAVVF